MRVLAVGAHPADVELGCGGALLAHRDRGDEIHMLVMTRPGRGLLPGSRGEAEQMLAAEQLGAMLHWGGFEDGAVPSTREAVAAVEAVLVACGCDVVYGHAPEDSHQDHRSTAQATLAAARRSRQLLWYELPTSLHFDPAIFVDLEGRVGAKLELLGAHRSQLDADGPIDFGAVAGRARHRGSQARVAHAEAFETHRFVWELAPAAFPGRRAAAALPFGARVLIDRRQEPSGGAFGEVAP